MKLLSNKKYNELIYRTIISTARTLGTNLSETKKLMIYNNVTKKRK